MVKKVYEGLYRERLREAMKRYKKTNDLTHLMLDMINIGDLIRYNWQLIYIIEHTYDIFKEVFPDRYVLNKILEWYKWNIKT